MRALRREEYPQVAVVVVGWTACGRTSGDCAAAAAATTSAVAAATSARSPTEAEAIRGQPAFDKVGRRPLDSDSFGEKALGTSENSGSGRESSEETRAHDGICGQRNTEILERMDSFNDEGKVRRRNGHSMRLGNNNC